jgi:hypothetical protein
MTLDNQLRCAGAGGALGHATAVTLAAVGLTVVAVGRPGQGSPGRIHIVAIRQPAGF